MRLLNRVLILAFVLAQSVWASPPCEGEMTRQSALLVRAVEIALRDHQFSPEDVEYMIHNGPGISNPWERKDREIRGVSLRQRMQRYLEQVPESQIAIIKFNLSKLLQADDEQRTAISESSEATAPVFKPKRIPGFEFADVREEIPTWHTDSRGNLKLVNYNPKTHHLQVIDPEKRALDHDFAFSNPQSLKPTSHSILSTPDGGLWVAQLFEDYKRLGIHDAVKNTTHYFELNRLISSIHLVRAADGAIYLIGQMSKGVQTYRVGETLEPLRNHDFKYTLNNFEVVNSPEGRIFILATEHVGGVYVIDPFQDRPLRLHQIEGGEPKRIEGVIAPNGDYVVSIVVGNAFSAAIRAEFLTSKSDFAVSTGNRKEFQTLGSPHLTHDNRILFPVSDKSGKGERVISIFEPLFPRYAEAKWWWERLRKKQGRYLPAQYLEAKDLGDNLLKWSTTQGGRSLLISYQNLAQGRAQVVIYEPAAQNAPIAWFALDGNDHRLMNVSAEIPVFTGQVVAFVRRFLDDPFQIYEATANARVLLAGPSEKISAVGRGKNNRLWIAGIRPGLFDRQGELQVYSLLNKIEVSP